MIGVVTTIKFRLISIYLKCLPVIYEGDDIILAITVTSGITLVALLRKVKDVKILLFFN